MVVEWRSVGWYYTGRGTEQKKAERLHRRMIYLANFSCEKVNKPIELVFCYIYSPLEILPKTFGFVESLQFHMVYWKTTSHLLERWSHCSLSAPPCTVWKRFVTLVMRNLQRWGWKSPLVLPGNVRYIPRSVDVYLVLLKIILPCGHGQANDK